MRRAAVIRPRLLSFDIDGTLESGDPPGIIPMRLDVIADFTVLKHRLADLKTRFDAAAYYHVGDTDIDEHFAMRPPTGRGDRRCSPTRPPGLPEAEELTRAYTVLVQAPSFSGLEG